MSQTREFYYRSALLSQTREFFTTGVHDCLGQSISFLQRTEAPAGRSKAAGGPIKKQSLADPQGPAGRSKGGRRADPKGPAGRSKGPGGPIQRHRRADPKLPEVRDRVSHHTYPITWMNKLVLRPKRKPHGFKMTPCCLLGPKQVPMPPT